MKIYTVGGAVRDKLLGLTPKDFDFLVTDSTREEMLKLGYFHVGISFPIFIDPQTQYEYAFPRGHSLEDDLYKRDLTMNAIAMDSDGNIIDPYGGVADLKNKIIRHVSDAFAEDPFRVYRVYRFKTRFSDFSIAPETIAQMRKVVSSAEFKLISPERIIKELNLVLSLPRPSVFFEGLKEIGALEPFFPELKALIDVPQSPTYHPEGDAWVHTMLVIDQAAMLTENILVRYSALVHDLGKGITPKEILPRHIGHEESGIKLVKDLGKRILAPNDWTEAAVTVTRFHLRVHRIFEVKPSSIVRMFYEMDAFRKPYLVEILALSSQADERGKLKTTDPGADYMRKCFAIVKDIGFKDIKAGLEGQAVGAAIREERVRVLIKSLNM